MTGLSLDLRVRLIDRLRDLVLERQRVYPTDLAVYRALALDFHNGKTGRTDPGYRAISRTAKVALGTVSACIRRLTHAGFIRVRRRLIYAGRWLRWTNCYELVAEPRSGSAAEPIPVVKKKEAPRSVAAQLQAIAGWVAEEQAQEERRCLRGASGWDGPGLAPWNPGGNARGGGGTAGGSERP
jgi:hypothetical protein